MKYYGIKTPEKEGGTSFIWYITDSEHRAWMKFFGDDGKSERYHPCRTPLADAIRAYKGIGYTCVELKLIEVKKWHGDGIGIS